MRELIASDDCCWLLVEAQFTVGCDCVLHPGSKVNNLCF